MNGGSKLLASAAVLALAGCGGPEATLQIRPTPTPLSATARPVPVRIAEANAHLALGNVALALESYRKALREQPDSVEAMVGLAICYDRMSRFDLSRRYYEAALAVVPADTRVLNALARSLDGQGLAEEAAEVRNEVAMRLAAAKLSTKPSPTQAMSAARPPKAAIQSQGATAGPSVTMVLPASRPVAAAPVEPLALSARPIPVREIAPAPIPARKPIMAAPPTARAVAARPMPVRQIAAAAPAAPIGPSVTVALPAPKPIPAEAALIDRSRQTPVAVARAVAPAPAVTPFVAPVVVPSAREVFAAPLPAAEAVPLVVAAPVARSPDVKASTRLERLSPGEVALITTDRPQWRSQVVGRTAQSTTIRYVPLRTAQMRPVQLRLLNAARYQGLAARTRRLLATRGWRQLAIGDATRVRRTSLILYPPNRRGTAERLAKQFGFPMAKRASGNEFVILLGRDATMIAGARTRG